MLFEVPYGCWCMRCSFINIQVQTSEGCALWPLTCSRLQPFPQVQGLNALPVTDGCWWWVHGGSSQTYVKTFYFSVCLKVFILKFDLKEKTEADREVHYPTSFPRQLYLIKETGWQNNPVTHHGAPKSMTWLFPLWTSRCANGWSSLHRDQLWQGKNNTVWVLFVVGKYCLRLSCRSKSNVKTSKQTNK